MNEKLTKEELRSRLITGLVELKKCYFANYPSLSNREQSKFEKYMKKLVDVVIPTK